MIKEFDEFLSRNGVAPEWAVMHPSVWNGYWSVVKRPKWFKAFRWIGKILKSRRIFWLGLSIYWVDGLKDIFIWNFIEEDIKDIFDA